MNNRFESSYIVKHPDPAKCVRDVVTVAPPSITPVDEDYPEWIHSRNWEERDRLEQIYYAAVQDPRNYITMDAKEIEPIIHEAFEIVLPSPWLKNLILHMLDRYYGPKIQNGKRVLRAPHYGDAKLYT